MSQKYFYQLMIPGLNLMGAPQPTQRLGHDMSFAVLERLRASFEPELHATPVRRYLFTLRKTYPIPEGICGLYELEEISK